MSDSESASVESGCGGHEVREVERVQTIDADQQHMLDLVVSPEQTVVGVSACLQSHEHTDAGGGAAQNFAFS